MFSLLIDRYVEIEMCMDPTIGYRGRFQEFCQNRGWNLTQRWDFTRVGTGITFHHSKLQR